MGAMARTPSSQTILEFYRTNAASLILVEFKLAKKLDLSDCQAFVMPALIRKADMRPGITPESAFGPRWLRTEGLTRLTRCVRLSTMIDSEEKPFPAIGATR